MPSARSRYVLLVLALAVVYVAGGRLGLQLDAVSGFATLVWPPAGLALAALLVGGLRLWPGVAIGAFVVNLWAADATVPVAVGIAMGNTLAAVAATAALHRIPGFHPSLQRTRDVLGLIVFGAALSTTISATIGATTLYLAGVVPAERFGVTWVVWWLGDAIADLVLTPLLLTWGAFRRGLAATHRAAEAFVLGIVLIGTTLLVFATRTDWSGALFVQPYLLAPPLLWAALRFQQRGATAAIFAVSVIAVWSTVRDLGPFTAGETYERLFAVQAFMALMTMTSLVLAAVVTQRAIAERELAVARDAAEAASRAKSRFLAVVSHELRTPLNGVIGYADLMLSDVAGPMTPMQTAYTARIRAAAWHLVGVIDGILTFTRGDAHRHDLRLEQVDATAIVHEAVAIVAPNAAARELDVRVSVPDQAVIMRTDPGKVRQILVNLLGNAVKFTNQQRIDFGMHTDEQWLTFHVRDYGPGIPLDQLERIFEPFTQLATDSSQLAGGTGLGLPVSRTLAEAMGGTVAVSSQLGVGSTFTVTLPLVTAAAASRSPP